MAQPHDEIPYRRMVSNIARELSTSDVEQIAYVRLTGKEDTTKYSAANPAASALDLLKTLERWGDFSVNNTDGLKEVVMDARRKDLVDKVNDFIKLDRPKNNNCNQCLKKLNFVTKNRLRNKGRPKIDVTLTEGLGSKFQVSEDWAIIAGAEGSDGAAQELLREIAQKSSRLATSSTHATEEGK